MTHHKPTTFKLVELIEDLIPNGVAEAREVYKNVQAVTPAWVQSNVQQIFVTDYKGLSIPLGERIYVYFNPEVEEWHPFFFAPGRFPIFLVCKTEIIDSEAAEGKKGAYDFQSAFIDSNTKRIEPDPDGIFGFYPVTYAIEINRTNANLHGPTHNIVMVEFVSHFDDGSSIFWFDKGLTDERFEDRDEFVPSMFEYCDDSSSSSSQ